MQLLHSPLPHPHSPRHPALPETVSHTGPNAEADTETHSGADCGSHPRTHTHPDTQAYAGAYNSSNAGANAYPHCGPDRQARAEPVHLLIRWWRWE